jgi:hypothetical protein
VPSQQASGDERPRDDQNEDDVEKAALAELVREHQPRDTHTRCERRGRDHDRPSAHVRPRITAYASLPREGSVIGDRLGLYLVASPVHTPAGHEPILRLAGLVVITESATLEA